MRSSPFLLQVIGLRALLAIVHATYGLGEEASAPQSAAFSLSLSSAQPPADGRSPPVENGSTQSAAAAAIGVYLPQLRAALGSIMHTCHLMFGQSLLIASKTSQGEQILSAHLVSRGCKHDGPTESSFHKRRSSNALTSS